MNVLNSTDLEHFIKEMTIVSGNIIKKYFRSNIGIQLKEDLSPVTIADREVEQALRSMILKQFPQHGIIAEEFGNYQEDADYIWVLDPIDGTTSFICGAVTFGTLIGLMYKGTPILGVFHQPILEQLLIGDGMVTRLNDVVVRVSDQQNLSKARLLTTDVFNIKKYQDIHTFEALHSKVAHFRSLGDCYGYYLVATGFSEIMIDPILSIWDIVALIPIIKGAGGIITDFKGGDPMITKNIVVSVPKLHKEVLDILNHKS